MGNWKCVDMKIIGISGKKRSGKDTVAQILGANFGLGYMRYGFASPLKKEVSDICHVSLDYLEQNKHIFRPMLQWWGTEFRRNMYGELYWIKKVEQAIHTFETFGSIKLLVIADVRFKNELDFIKSKGGITVRVIRPALPIDNHQSETELDNEKFDIVINNDGDIQDLITQVQNKIRL